MLNEGSSLVCHEEEEFDFRLWDPGSDSSSESGSQQGNDESTYVAYHLICPNIFSDFTPFKSWVNFLQQPLNSFRWSIYVRFMVRFSASIIFIAPIRLGILQVYADSMNYDVHGMIVLAFEQLISYIIHLGQVLTFFWIIHGPWIYFYIIIAASQHNRVWDPGVGRLYLWLDKDFIVVLFSLRLIMVVISADQFTGTTFLRRVIWDSGIQLTSVLQSGTVLHSLAGFVVNLGYWINYRFIWDPGTHCLRASNLKEGRFVMSLLWGH